ncbi:MAG: hypothetical protein ACYSWU_14095 [Planctomycetota bacterium]
MGIVVVGCSPIVPAGTCVNGIVDLMELLADGDFVTIDGHLGIVTVGPPEFGVELEVIADETS